MLDLRKNFGIQETVCIFNFCYNACVRSFRLKYSFFPSCYSFLFHKQFHLPNARPKICLICEIHFADEEDFYNHVMFSHERLFEYFCDRCDKSFSTKAQLDRHIKGHNSTPHFDCSQCDSTFESRSKLDEHMSIKHMMTAPSKSLECSICDKIFVRASRLRKHMTTHEIHETNLTITCTPCSMVFADDERAAEHCQQEHEASIEMMIEKSLDEAYCCEFCENAFFSIAVLMEHRKQHTSTQPYECHLCSSTYDSFSRLKTHKQSHANANSAFPVVRKYVCDDPNCYKPYRHWSDLTYHRKTVHLINPSILKCGDCGKTFYQSWKLSYHCKSVHGEPMQCDMCDVTVPNAIRLQAHKRRHHGKGKATHTKPPKRPSSARTATKVPTPAATTQTKRKTPYNIDEYVRMEGDRMFCTACNKHMLSRNNARSHIEIVHLKVRKFSCKACDRHFYLRKDYDDHMRTHTAEMPFKCVEEECGKMFRTSSLLAEHRKYV